MGHLINPIAFRLGWQRNWVDQFYTEFRFYPELLHRLLRFRFFLNCLFHPLVNSSFNCYLVSHFRFSSSLIGFSLEIYYYNSRMDVSWYDFCDKISELTFGFKFFPKSWDQPSVLSSWNRKWFSLLFLLYLFGGSGNLNLPHYQHRLEIVCSLDESSHTDLIISHYKNRLWSKISAEEITALGFLHGIKQFTLDNDWTFKKAFRGEPMSMVNYEYVAQNMFRFIFLEHMTKPFFKTYALFLSFAANFFFLCYPLKFIRFLQVTNDQLSARFLAYFIAIRLSQGYSIRPLLNPIRRDLRLSRKFAFHVHYKQRINLAKGEHHSLRSKHYLLLTTLLVKLNSFYSSKFFTNSSLWSFDHFFLFFNNLRECPLWQAPSYNKRILWSYLSIDSTNKKKNWGPRQNRIRYTKEYTKYLKTRLNFFKEKYTFFRLFFEKRCLYAFAYRFSIESKKLLLFYGNPITFWRELISEYCLNYEGAYSFDLTNSFFSLRGLNSGLLMSITTNVLLNFLQFSYKGVPRARVYDTVFEVNRKKFRLFTPPADGLRGFRISLHGRFTRKQIAASYRIQEGSLPLSKMSASIDYGFTTVALRNSAIGVKVWLYRQGNFSSFDHHLFTYETAT